MAPPIKRTAKNKKKYESFGELTKRQAAALKKFEESKTAGEKNRSALKALKRVFPEGIGNLVLGAGQSLVDKEGGNARIKRGAKSLDTAISTSQNQDIKEERARKAHNSKQRSQGRKDGGMNAVPSKYEGFSKLPEGVQEKISPKLAGKYKTGGMSKAVLKARGGTFKGTF